jgi:hypothetical protein
MIRWFQALIHQPYVQLVWALPLGEGGPCLEVMTTDGSQHQIHNGLELVRFKYSYSDPDLGGIGV